MDVANYGVIPPAADGVRVHFDILGGNFADLVVSMAAVHMSHDVDNLLFTGGSGDDYVWEKGKTPPNAKSFYYENRLERAEVLSRAVVDSVPLGLGISEPVFGIWQG